MTLIDAVKRGDVAAVKLLLDQGADPNIREVVLTKPSVADRSEGGKPTLADTALMIAVQNGNAQVVKLLLHKGADVNGRGVAGLEVREHLLQRNGEPISLAEFKPTSPHILLEGENAVRSRFGILGEKAGRARAWVQIFLPGYSKSHDGAALRFWLGPSPHGAAGIYFLVKQGAMWRVSWRHFAFFV